ncbi:MAG: peptide chain release factor I [Lentisphaerae bacterium RIFOXYB12_FULL_65_16]|nr:MAG: peptide chain release factor I [Lentisphaerae bacterium RIFOXYA12_64_32]OGV89910.1 MAG: peptide chain release factor I [Lentisphaerae bacterium RIFOXYB12_FULL_65_16]
MDTTLQVTPSLRLREDELAFAFVKASGPGGQNVNKVSTAAELRFDIRRSTSLPESVKQRLLRLAGRQVTADGVLLIDAHRFRSQLMNRDDAVERLIALVRKAAVPPRPRRKTKPSLGSKQRRLESKRRRGDTKSGRGRPGNDE